MRIHLPSVFHGIRRGRPIHLPAPKVSGSRVSIAVPGGDIWFESDDLTPAPSMEAFAGIMMVPAMANRSMLTAELPVNAAWLAGARRNAARFREWWGYKVDPLAELETTDEEPPAGPGAAVCFSGGVDSFHELLREPDRFTHLMSLHGADIRLNDTVKANDVHAMLNDVAGEIDKTPVWVRTNVQDHPLARSEAWTNMHGAVLAGVGHMMRGEVGSLTIAASYDHRRLRPWGTHPQVDPDFSSAAFSVFHGDYHRTRTQRLQAVASHPLVRRYLRVCLKRRVATGNCSNCRKCVLTMCQLAAIGELEQNETFDKAVPLAKRLDDLRHGDVRRSKQWRDLFEEGELPPDVAAAVTRLIERTAT